MDPIVAWSLAALATALALLAIGYLLNPPPIDVTELLSY